MSEPNQTTDPRENIQELTSLLREINDKLEAEPDGWRPVDRFVEAINRIGGGVLLGALFLCATHLLIGWPW